VTTRLSVLAVVLTLLAGQSRAQVTIHFAASDGVVVYGDLYTAPGVLKGTVLLFHQSMSNRGEYETIGPLFAKAGYNALAVDQRAGGHRWGRENLTMQGIGPEASEQIQREGRFANALRDLEAALDYAAKRPSRPIIVVVSGYSAALVFLLAARHRETVGAVLAFSPGEYVQGVSVHDAAARVTCPVFVTSDDDPGEIDDAEKVLDAVPGKIKVMFRPRHAMQGATMLRADINLRGSSENWAAVLEFLALIDREPPA
jgi:dienelactone hydrolase